MTLDQQVHPSVVAVQSDSEAIGLVLGESCLQQAAANSRTCPSPTRPVSGVLDCSRRARAWPTSLRNTSILPGSSQRSHCAGVMASPSPLRQAPVKPNHPAVLDQADPKSYDPGKAYLPAWSGAVPGAAVGTEADFKNIGTQEWSPASDRATSAASYTMYQLK